MVGTPVLGPAACETVAPSAVVWVNGRRAVVVAIGREGNISTCEIGRGWWGQATYLAHVARAIGDRQRVVILGPSSVRLALERTYVATFQRRDRLVDVEPAGLVPTDELLDRLHTLAA